MHPHIQKLATDYTDFANAGRAISQHLEQISHDVLQVRDESRYSALHRPEQGGWIPAEFKP